MDKSIYQQCAEIALAQAYETPAEADAEAQLAAHASSRTARIIARQIWHLARANHPDEKELRESERISAAQAMYDEMLSDTSPDDPEYGVRAFDAMKAALARAEAVRLEHEGSTAPTFAL